MAEEQKLSAHDEVRKALSELHEALSKESELDPDLRTGLEDAAAEITKDLERSSGEGAEQENTQLSDTAQDLALELEVSHPVLTDVLNRLSGLLSSLGI